MNQEKIGKFIAINRKRQKLTQVELAEKLGVTDRSVSKWENGKGLPDVSLFEDLCEILDINVNELLKGEKISSNNIDEESHNNLIKYLKRKEKRKIINIALTVIIVISAICIFLILSLNKTYFRTIYNSNYIENINIPIPKYSYYRSTRGIGTFTTKLKTLKQPDEVNIVIDNYLNKLEKMKCGNNIYYYNKNNNFTILQYRINNDGIGFINTIYITYSKNKVCD